MTLRIAGATGDWPGYLDMSVGRQARCISSLNYLRGMSVTGLAGTVGNLLAEASFFEADFGFFDFRRQAASLQEIGRASCRERVCLAV